MIKNTYKMHMISADIITKNIFLVSRGEKILREILGFDIDDTIADGVSYFVDKLNDYFNMNIKVEDVNGSLCDTFNIPQSEIDKFFSAFGDEIFKNLNILPNSVDYINELYDKGHKIIIITARPLEVKNTTVKWLELKGVKYHELIFDEEKSVIAKEKGIKIFVDDTKKIVESMKDVGITPIFMDIPKNKNISTSDGVYRAKDWKEIYFLIENLLQGS